MTSGPSHDTAISTGKPSSLRGWRLWLGVILLLILAGVTIALGTWQLSRADEKRAIAERVAEGRKQPPLALTPGVTPAGLMAWRPAWAHGTWLPGYSVLLDNRNRDGKPGYWVATPLCMASPDAPALPPDVAADCDRAVLVLRGWMARGAPGASQPVPPEPLGNEAHGVLLSHVPRLFDLTALGMGEVAAPVYEWADGMPVVQNLELSDYASATGLPLLPMVLQQEDGSDDLIRDWAGPPVDVDKHRGYALQWFSFAAIALIALGVILVKAARNQHR